MFANAVGDVGIPAAFADGKVGLSSAAGGGWSRLHYGGIVVPPMPYGSYFAYGDWIDIDAPITLKSGATTFRFHNGTVADDVFFTNVAPNNAATNVIFRLGIDFDFGYTTPLYIFGTPAVWGRLPSPFFRGVYYNTERSFSRYRFFCYVPMYNRVGYTILAPGTYTIDYMHGLIDAAPEW